MKLTLEANKDICRVSHLCQFFGGDEDEVLVKALAQCLYMESASAA